jgi:hypothetical protein
MFFLKLLLELKEMLPKKLVEFGEVNQADIVFGEYDVIARLTTPDFDYFQRIQGQKRSTKKQVTASFIKFKFQFLREILSGISF